MSGGPRRSTRGQPKTPPRGRGQSPSAGSGLPASSAQPEGSLRSPRQIGAQQGASPEKSTLSKSQVKRYKRRLKSGGQAAELARARLEAARTPTPTPAPLPVDDTTEGTEEDTVPTGERKRKKKESRLARVAQSENVAAQSSVGVGRVQDVDVRQKLFVAPGDPQGRRASSVAAEPRAKKRKMDVEEDVEEGDEYEEEGEEDEEDPDDDEVEEVEGQGGNEDEEGDSGEANPETVTDSGVPTNRQSSEMTPGGSISPSAMSTRKRKETTSQVSHSKFVYYSRNMSVNYSKFSSQSCAWAT